MYVCNVCMTPSPVYIYELWMFTQPVKGPACPFRTQVVINQVSSKYPHGAREEFQAWPFNAAALRTSPSYQ